MTDSAIFHTSVSKGGETRWEELTENDGVFFSRSRTNLTCKRKFLVPYDELDDLHLELFPPDSYFTAEHPNLSGMYADSLDMNPAISEETVEYSPGLAAPNLYVCVVGYAPWEATEPTTLGTNPTGTMNNLDLLVGNMNFHTEAMTLPGESFQWEEGDKAVRRGEINPVVMIQIMDFTLTRPRVPFIPFFAIRKNIGKVNKLEFAGAAPETLLYLGTSAKFRLSSTGERQFDLEHRMSEKRIPSPATVDVGDYKGFSNTYVGLPRTSVGTGGVGEGDYAFLTKKDGDHSRGEYVYDGSKYIYANSSDAVYGWNHYLNPATAKWDRLKNKDSGLFTYQHAPNLAALLT